MCWSTAAAPALIRASSSFKFGSASTAALQILQLLTDYSRSTAHAEGRATGCNMLTTVLLHRTGSFALAIALAFRGALVVLLLAFCQADLALDPAL